MKTIRNELKYPISERLPIFLKEGILEGIKKLFNFFAVTKRTTNTQQTRNQIKLGRECFRNRKAILWPSKCLGLHFLQAR